MKKNLKTILVVVVSLVVLACTIFLVWTYFNDKAKKLNNKTDRTTSNEEKKQDNKKEELDVNSDLVKKLSKKLDYELKSSSYLKNEYNSSTDEKEKLRIITTSLDENAGIKNTCSEFNSKHKLDKIPSIHGKYKLLHECSEDSGVNSKETISYSKEYVEKLAKSLFGSSYKLNTELPLSYCSCAKTCNDAPSEIGYYFDKASDLYVHYSGNDAAGGIGCGTLQHTKKIVSAEKVNDEITLDISYTSKPGLDNSESSISEFIYKFKKDKDNNYYLVSKTKKK